MELWYSFIVMTLGHLLAIKGFPLCKVETVDVPGSRSVMIRVIQPVNITTARLTSAIGFLNFISANQSPYRLIGCDVDKERNSNSCISYSAPPLKDMCGNIVVKLDFRTRSDEFAAILKNPEASGSKKGKLYLSVESGGLAPDFVCDFEYPAITAPTATAIKAANSISVQVTTLHLPKSAKKTTRRNSSAITTPLFVTALSKPENKSKNHTRLIVIITPVVVVLALSIIIGLAVFSYLRSRQRRYHIDQGNDPERLEMN